MTPDVQNLIALPPGYRLGEYRIERYLGSGGFGITYSAIDEHLDHRVAIKEFLPSSLAVRNTNGRVTVATAEDEPDFQWGLERFLDEARALARFDHPNIVSVKRFLEAHGTGYIVMEYVDGEPLSEMLRRKPTLTEAEIREHVLPLTGGLAKVHSDGLLHRDIKPSNIVVRANGVPVLIDFGSARRAVSAKSRSLTAVITPGYAPLEQYSSSMGDQRATTDIYALGAVLYRCVTGKTPWDATERALEDRLTPAVESADGVYSAGLLTAIDAALAMRADERPRDIAAFLQLVFAGDNQGERPEYAGERIGRSGRARGFAPDDGLARNGSRHSSKPRSTSNTEKPAKRAFVATAAIVGVFVVVAILFFAALNSGQWVDSELAPAQTLSTGGNDPTEAVGTASPTADNERAFADAFDATMNAYDREEYEFALREFHRLADLGNAEAQRMLGVMYYRGLGVPRDVAQSVHWYTRAAEQGHAGAQIYLANMYATNSEFAAEAVHWYTRAAEQGDRSAQFNLGSIYDHGWGVVPEDDAQAVRWYTRAAERGHPGAQSRLARTLFANGEGVLADKVVAYVWANLASAQGLVGAATLRDEIAATLSGPQLAEAQELSCEYHNGVGLVLEDDAHAVQWYRSAAGRGHAGAQSFLARRYANGEGVLADKVIAYVWANLASAQGLVDAATLRDEIAATLSGPQLAEAQELLSSFGELREAWIQISC